MACARVLWLVLGLLTQPPQTMRLELTPAEPRQGQVVLLEVHGAGPADRLEGSLCGHPLRFYRDERGRHRALGVVPLEAQPGPQPVLVRLQPLVDDPVFQGQPVTVRRGRFPVQRLRVAPDYVRMPQALQRRVERENRALDRVLQAAPTPRRWRGSFHWPRRGRITAGFGLQRVFNRVPAGRHLGLDIAGRTGEPVRAIGAGTVVMVARRHIGGGTVVIDHGMGLHSRYSHLSAFSVREGEAVRRGQKIGAVGRTGRVTGPHLHLAVDLAGVHVDPLSLLDLDLEPGPGADERERTPTCIRSDRALEVLIGPIERTSWRGLVRQAGYALGAWRLSLARVGFDGDDLVRWSRRALDDPFVRVLRESLGRPVDPGDFIYFIDDVLAAGRRGLRGVPLRVGSGSARDAGILLHPDEVFGAGSPRLYGAGGGCTHLTMSARRGRPAPARDGSPPAAGWVMRYRNPSGRAAKLAALDTRNPGTFGARVRSLVRQLEAQGAEVTVWSTIRDRRRGYLMWGAYLLSRKHSQAAVQRGVHLLDRVNRDWGLRVPIRWLHPGGWRATVRAARVMADAYDVVYATMDGARSSRHYDAEAVDLTAVDLPRSLTLAAPHGARRTFDLSAPHQPRDLSLSPGLIEWIEVHFRMEKLRDDYPHWNDADIPLAPLRVASHP